MLVVEEELRMQVLLIKLEEMLELFLKLFTVPDIPIIPVHDPMVQVEEVKIMDKDKDLVAVQILDLQVLDPIMPRDTETVVVEEEYLME